MPAEETQKIGIEGLLRAKVHLERVLGDKINLTYNAYDNANRLRFVGEGDLGTFSFDWRGHLRRPAARPVFNSLTADVFVEVKNYADGSSLLAEFRTFLKRASHVGTIQEHVDTWFVFFATVPFGCSEGVSLCNGVLLDKEAKDWSPALQAGAASIKDRIAVVISTASENRLLEQWWSRSASATVVP